MRFCLFLHEQGLIGDRDCVRALREISDRTPPLGRLAIRSKLLTVAQLRDLLGKQTAGGGPIGHLAVTEGLLSVEQLRVLVEKQREGTPHGREIVSELEILTPEAVERAWSKFLQLTF